MVKEIKKDKREDLFAATPPIEALRILFSLAVTQGVGYKNHRYSGMKIDFIDVKKAYLNAKATREIFIQLPDEDHEPSMCGKLKKAMYGTRDGAQNWEDEYMHFMKDLGFISGSSTPCVFHHPGRNLRVVVHGDDFTILGYAQELDWFRDRISKNTKSRSEGDLDLNLKITEKSEYSAAWWLGQ